MNLPSVGTPFDIARDDTLDESLPDLLRRFFAEGRQEIERAART